MFEPLKAKKLFATARQDEVMQTVILENGADLAAEYLLDLMSRQMRKAA